MRNRLLPFLLALSGCAVGPSHQPPVVAPEVTHVSVRVPDSMQAKLDTVVHVRDSVLGDPERPREALEGAAWVNLVQDTVLVDLIRRAVRQNRDLQVAVARVREGRALAGAAKGPLFPQLFANGNASTNRVVFGAFEAQTFDAFRVTADVAWELDFWGGIRRSVQAANLDAEAADEDRRAVILTLVSDVAIAYVELRELDDDLAISLRTLDSRRETLRIARRRFEQGLISELDVRQFESEVAGPAARVAEFQRLIIQKENQLRVLLGDGPGPIPRGLPLSEVVRGLDVPDSLPSTLVAQRPDVRRADRELAAATARIGVAIANRLPLFLVTGQYGSQSQTVDNLFTGANEIYTLQGGITIPLFTGGRLVNEQRAAEARAEQARMRYEQSVLVALQEVGDALVGVTTTRDQAAAVDMQVASLQRALALATMRYEAGLSSYLDLLEAQRALYVAELTQAQTRRERLTSAVQLYKALGGTWE